MTRSFTINQTAIHYPSLTHSGKIDGMTSLAVNVNPGFKIPATSQNDANTTKLLSDESIAWLTSQQIDPGRTVLARQVHGADVMYATEPGIYNQPDGFFTDKSGIHLIIRTADCAAVLVSIVEIPAVGIVHVGWRGAHKNILTNLIIEMKERWPGESHTFRVAISPHIKKCCYEVGNEFSQYFSRQSLIQREGKLYFDLEQTIVEQLLVQQIPAENITIVPHCTACSDLPLYSWRRQRTTQRLLNVISIKENF